jgi:hypothetical protein
MVETLSQYINSEQNSMQMSFGWENVDFWENFNFFLSYFNTHMFQTLNMVYFSDFKVFYPISKNYSLGRYYDLVNNFIFNIVTFKNCVE